MDIRRIGLPAGLMMVTIVAICLQACGTPENTNTAAVLLRDINAYRKQQATLEPEASVKQWFALYDRAADLDRDDYSPEAFDYAVIDTVGEASLLASLPPPAAWAAFRAEAERRVGTRKPERASLGLRYLAEVLSGDHQAAGVTLSEFEGDEVREAVAAGRSLLVRIYGDAEAQVAAFRLDLNAPASFFANEDHLKVPDLFAMVGEARATTLLEEAIFSRRKLQIENGDATRALARRLALAHVDRMQVPQWGLAHSVDAAPLYEAMSARFESNGKKSSAGSHDSTWRTASAYYFLEMVKTGRQTAAEEALTYLSSGGTLEIPHEVIEALQRAQLHEPLFRFLDGLLARRPELGAWDVYIEQAAYTGHGADALALIDRQLKRDNLPATVRADLQARRVAALLAADLIKDANAAFRQFLAKPPTAGEPGLRERTQVAIKAARAGRLLDDAKLADLGTDFLLARFALPSAKDASGEFSEAQRTLYAELRQQGREQQVLKILSRKLNAKPTSFSEAFERRAGLDGEDARQSLVEIAGIHSSAGRHAEVLSLLSTSPRWGATDLVDVIRTEDSRHQPLGAMVARALQATGDKAAALRVARATVAELPERDAGYEVIAALDPDAAATFDTLFEVDEFEERPLIWKASTQLAGGSVDEAEATIRRAIAVDPSDGEQGPNDRMRAYAVLAEILRRKGNERDAQLYANAVEAIRLSERGDQFHAAGLYERAFRTYREALAKFSDAYCIQSRLAVQLNKQGRRREALEHYRRAYELMPSSFGRVESHCFGCESVFQDLESQTLAERVFTDIIRKTPSSPQAHYLLAYLREQQGRPAEAIQPLRTAVALDPNYLNAWKRLDDLADKTYLDGGDRDIARLRLLDLDPLQRHGYYDFDEVGQLAALWNGLEHANARATRIAPPPEALYSLRASAALVEEANGSVSADMREMQRRIFFGPALKGPAVAFYEHALVVNARSLMGLETLGLLD